MNEVATLPARAPDENLFRAALIEEPSADRREWIAQVLILAVAAERPVGDGPPAIILDIKLHEVFAAELRPAITQIRDADRVLEVDHVFAQLAVPFRALEAHGISGTRAEIDDGSRTRARGPAPHIGVHREILGNQKCLGLQHDTTADHRGEMKHHVETVVGAIEVAAAILLDEGEAAPRRVRPILRTHCPGSAREFIDANDIDAFRHQLAAEMASHKSGSAGHQCTRHPLSLSDPAGHLKRWMSRSPHRPCHHITDRKFDPSGIDIDHPLVPFVSRRCDPLAIGECTLAQTPNEIVVFHHHHLLGEGSGIAALKNQPRLVVFDFSGNKRIAAGDHRYARHQRLGGDETVGSGIRDSMKK